MKILFKNRSFGGGAPRSMLEYAKLAQKNGHTAIAVGQYTHNPEYYHDYGVKTFNVPFFSLIRPFKNFYAYYLLWKVIKVEKPDLIQVVTKTECIFLRVISIFLNIPTIYTIPGGQVNYITSRLLRGEDLLVFSEENRTNLVAYGFDDKKIILNSNRMSFPSENLYNVKPYKASLDKKLNLLFIGRIDSNYKAILKVMQVVEFLGEKGIEVCFKVLGDGSKLTELQQKGQEINGNQENVDISFEGFCNNINQYVEVSHIVFGKGRSIIDSVASKRISFVAAESGQLIQVTPENIHSLSKYNFTGRSSIVNKTDEDLNYILCIARDALTQRVDMNKLEQNRTAIQEYYDIEYSESKILEIYENTIKKKIEKNIFSRLIIAINTLATIYLVFIKQVILKRNAKYKGSY